MKVSATHRYTCDMDELFSHFCKPDFYKKKFKACGARNIKVLESAQDGDAFSITTEREVRADVPGVLKSFLGEWNTLTQTESWEGEAGDEYYSELEISSAGAPVTIEGGMVLTPDGDGCINEIDIEIRCSIPLVGKKLEQFVAADTEKTLAAEYEYIRKLIK